MPWIQCLFCFVSTCCRYEVLCVSLSLCHQVDPGELTLIYNLRKLTKNDWVRRARVLTTVTVEHDFWTVFDEYSLSCPRPEVPSSPLCLRRGLFTLQSLPTCHKSCSERSEEIWLYLTDCHSRLVFAFNCWLRSIAYWHFFYRQGATKRIVCLTIVQENTFLAVFVHKKGFLLPFHM